MTEALPPFRVLAVTDNWTLLCGYSRDEILGKSLSILQVTTVFTQAPESVVVRGGLGWNGAGGPGWNGAVGMREAGCDWEVIGQVIGQVLGHLRGGWWPGWRTERGVVGERKRVAQG